MKAVLMLAVLLPLVVVTAWFLTRPIVERINRRRRIEQLEAENERLDNLLRFEQRKQRTERRQ